MMWSFFPWPVMFVIPVFFAVMVFMALRSGLGRGRMGPSCGSAAPLARPLARAGEPVNPPAGDDPMTTLRERYARGDIDTAEFEHRIEGLLRTDPGGSTPWSETRIPSGFPRSRS